MMDPYQQIIPAQRIDLPRLIKARAIPARFDDSTHQLWDLETDQGDLFLKLCDQQAVEKSIFWQGMTVLFNLDLPRSLGHFSQVYRLIAAHSPLEIPHLLASTASDETQQYKGFLLTNALQGMAIEPECVSDEMVMALANHLAALHCDNQPNWGCIQKADKSALEWPKALHKTLTNMATQQEIITLPAVQAAIAATKHCQSDHFVPLMLDLRWDQFLQQAGALTALVDLDAFVFAPRELDFVLLEYLLDDKQATIFVEAYTQHHEIPNMTFVREPYRLLLFLFQVLAEQDVARWLNAETRF